MTPFSLKLEGKTWLCGMDGVRVLMCATTEMPQEAIEVARAMPEELRALIESQIRSYKQQDNPPWRIDKTELARWVGYDKLEWFEQGRIVTTKEPGWIGEWKYDRNLFIPALHVAPDTAFMSQSEKGQLLLWDDSFMFLVMRLASSEPAPMRLRVVDEKTRWN